MLSSLFGFLYVPLFLINAVAILNEERFLAKIGWSTRQPTGSNSGFGSEPSYNAGGGYGANSDGGVSLKHKTINLISSVRTLMRPPLIVLNILVIVWEILVG